MRSKANNLKWLLCVLFLIGVVHSTATGRIIYVDDDAVGAGDGSSWANAFNYLQDALITASAGDEIRIAEGIYRPNQGLIPLPGRVPRTPDKFGRSATFRLKAEVIIKGGFAGFGASDPNQRDPEIYRTILSGDLDENDINVNEPRDLANEPTRAENSHNVLTIFEDDSNIILDGLIVTSATKGGLANISGNPSISNCVFMNNSNDDDGGAIVSIDGSTFLTNCKFISNFAAEHGGAIYSDYGNDVFVECSFVENSALDGTGIVNIEGNLELESCTFSHNSTYSLSSANEEGGGAVFIVSKKVVVKNCLFNENVARYGGAMVGIADALILERCVFTGNSAEYGGAIYDLRGGTITNSIFAANRGDKGGAVFGRCIGPALINCTLSGNSAQNGNAIGWFPCYENPSFTMNIRNCILRNGGDEIGKWEDELPDISIVYSDIQGGWPGEGNIDIDPQFTDFENGDFHLKSRAGRWDPNNQSWIVDDVTSPCIDTGDPSSPVAFEQFPNGGIINMGAYGGTAEASKSPSGINAKYGGGSGTADDPYLIYTAEQMNTVGVEPNDWDKQFKLMADIDLSVYTGTDFNIIGNGLLPAFSGVFDGNGHTISNFSYTSSYVGYQGLFRYVSGRNAQIKNLGLIGPNVNAGTGSDVGSLAGCVTSGIIINCYVDGGVVAGKRRIGGLVGWNDGSIKVCFSACNVSADEEVGGLVGYNAGEISNCHTGGEIFGLRNVGGLAGSSSGTIKNSSAAGTVGGGGDYAGGLVGINSGLLLSCSAGGEVFGDAQAGGLVGNSSDLIIDCYAAGGVSGTENVGGLVGRAYASIINCYASGSVSGTTNAGGLVGLGLENYISYGGAINSFWDIESSGQLTSDGGIGKTTNEMQDPNTFMDAGWDFVAAPDGPSDIWAEPEGGGYPVLWWQLTPLPQLPAFSGGTGGPDDPYLISTADELNSIGHNPRLMSAHFQLINDIDLAGVSFFVIAGQWYPFGGTFDGNCHTISNFSYTSAEATGVGLFGYVAGGQIVDLGLIDSYMSIKKGLFHAGLAGHLEGGAITNCYVEAGSISGGDYVGGLVGISGYDWNSLVTISNCYVTGSIAGDDYVGGLVGGNGAEIAECYVTGSIDGDEDVGGLVGSNDGEITNCYAIADVSGGEHVGGLLGFSAQVSSPRSGSQPGIERCYAAGRVSGDEKVGGLAGQSGGGITACFWDTETSGQSTSRGGDGKTTAEMQTAGTFLDARWDFVDETENGTEDIWWILEEQDYPRLWWERTENHPPDRRIIIDCIRM
jgi:predicted outer membrane repeat protein